MSVPSDSMQRRGSFSYLQDQVSFVSVDATRGVCIERINNNVARVYLVDYQRVPLPMPDDIIMTDGQGVAVPPFMNSFLITWVDTYTLSVRDERGVLTPCLVLHNQKQQSIWAPAGAALV